MKIKVEQFISEHCPISHGGKNSVTSDIMNPDIIDFSSNINPTGMPNSTMLSLSNILKHGTCALLEYPDPYSKNLTQNIARYTKLPYNNIIVGNGAIEILYNFCKIFLPNKNVLIPIPTFGEYEAASALSNCKIEFFKTMDISQNLDHFISKIPINGGIFLCNPNNPTGTILSKKDVTKIIAAAESMSCFVLVDECFIELVPKSNESVISLVKKYNNLLVLRSLTKSFGLAGIRVGYAAASNEIIDILYKIKIPWSVNVLADIAGTSALQDHTIYLEKSNHVIERESNYLQKHINAMKNYNCIGNSVTNFILIKTRYNSSTIQKKLLKNGILIRDCKNFRGLDYNYYIRIAVRSHNDNLILTKALENI